MLATLLGTPLALQYRWLVLFSTIIPKLAAHRSKPEKIAGDFVL
jgi:hypothetical protein